MAQTVKLSNDLANLARQEAELHNRALSNQITQWMSIGRVIERSGIYDYSGQEFEAFSKGGKLAQ